MSERTERRSVTRQSYRLKGPLVCAQCGTVSGPGAPSWLGCRTDEPGDEPGVAFFCPDCWQAEFDAPR